MLFAILSSLWALLLVPPVVYYVWMIKKKAWSVTTDSNYQPKVSLIVATYNEAMVVDKKLENLQMLDYPESRLQVIFVDSASPDGTMNICRDFLARRGFRFAITLLSEKERLGKSHALNAALQHVDGEIIATSDADSYWEPDALRKAVSYFADPLVGAATGRERLSNLKRSFHTMSEGIYREFYYTMRLGESKIHSTLIFQGELSLYRRSAFEKFEDRPGYSDDNGTAIKIVTNGYRCIFIPDAVFYDTAAVSLNGRLAVKSRRAQHLIAGIIESFVLKIKGRIRLPSLVVFFNFYLYVMSPMLLLVTLFATAIAYVINFGSYWSLALLILPISVMEKPRLFSVSYLTSNLALVIGLLRHLRKRRTNVWQKVTEMRTQY